MSLQVWTGFFIACWMISLSPGAGAIASMSAGVTLGFRRGYWTAIGLQLGLALQIAIVAVGVGALLATSQLAFTRRACSDPRRGCHGLARTSAALCAA